MPIEPLHVQTASHTYPVIVGSGVLGTLPARLAEMEVRGRLWLISDSTVAPLHGTTLIDHLHDAGYTVQHATVPAGEPSKSIDAYWRLCGWLIEQGIERRDCVLALGGGVVGDLAGFVAASVLRGVAFVQVPTTLLAMVDAAIGGKTGINHPLGKNLVGAFHQPRMVLADTATLHTLPPRELRAGWAEAIKHGVIRSAPLFETLAANAPTLAGDGDQPAPLPEPLTSDVVRQAAAVKVDVVSNDEREAGLRMILNYGHTLGHALEAVTGYTRLLHGEAVAIGMHAAAGIAVALGMLSPDLRARQQQVLHAYGLPTALPPDIDREQMLALTSRDKKVQAQRIRWILPDTLGSVVIRDDVPPDVVRSVVLHA